jgi:hypothetical protein
MNQSRQGKWIAPVVDVFPHLMVGFHDQARVREEMRLLRQLGFERVYFVLCNPGYPMFSNPALSLLPPDIPGLENFAARSIEALDGEPDRAYAEACRAEGMEAMAILKPYEGGGGATIPHGARSVLQGPRFTCLGGERFGFDALLSRHPELRVSRRPEPDEDSVKKLPVDRIEIVFAAFDVSGIDETMDAPLPEDGAEMIFELFTSEDNGTYVPLANPVRVRVSRQERLLSDANGNLLFPHPQPVAVCALTGFCIPPEIPYLAVLLHGTNKPFLLPQSMIRLYSGDREIPCTVTPFVRTPGNTRQSEIPAAERLWGMENQPAIPENTAAAREQFPQWGFEHEWYGSGFWGPGWRNASAYGIARGKLAWMKGTPCEAYPEVRDYWLDWVRQVLQWGFDGIDIRLQNHSSMVSDYRHYGFNPPLQEAYRSRHGIDILQTAPDPLELMALRGEFFLEFLGEASSAIHADGKKLQIHLRHCHEEPRLSHEFNQLGFWAMPKIWLRDWERAVDLADEITLKDYYFRDYRPEWSRRIKARAMAQGKRVWVHCYISQAQELRSDFFQAIEADPTVGGILLYEVAHSLKNEVNHGLIEQYGPAGLHEPTVQKLRQILREIGWSTPPGQAS